MLLCTKTHFITSLERLLSGEEGPGSAEERKHAGDEMKQRIRDYASDESGLLPGPVVMSWNTRYPPAPVDERDSVFATFSVMVDSAFGTFSVMVDGISPRPGQRIIYVDGGFDLFSSGHIEFLRQVVKREDELGHSSGWFENAASKARIKEAGEDYGPAFVIAGIHDDTVINYWKGVNYPIMNIFERGLCVLQCRVSFAITPFRSFCSSSSTYSTKVHQLDHFLGPFHPHQSIPDPDPLWHPRCSIPRPDLLYSAHARSIC